MATAPSPNDLTRQQLDELDALLQRMLSLPLTPADAPVPAAPPMPEPPVPPVPPSWRVDPPAVSMAASAPHLLLADPPAPPPNPAPMPAPRPVAKTAPPQAAAPTPAPVVSAPPQASVPMPAPMPAPRPRPAAPVTPAPSATGLTPVPAAPPVPFIFLPLVALNAAFDALCGLLGWPGRVLRSGFFKHLYGLAGLALIAYTLAHVAQVQGWAALPVSLPWPR